MSLINDDDILENDLINFDGLFENNNGLRASAAEDQPFVQEDYSNMTMAQSINRLFKFVEIESNIGLEKLDGNYQRLKDKIQELVGVYEQAY